MGRRKKNRFKGFHDGLCPKEVGDGDCCCLVKYIEELEDKIENALEYIEVNKADMMDAYIDLKDILN